jgi:hypothetical protein
MSFLELPRASSSFLELPRASSVMLRNQPNTKVLSYECLLVQAEDCRLEEKRAIGRVRAHSVHFLVEVYGSGCDSEWYVACGCI